MNGYWLLGTGVSGLLIGVGGWFGWQLLRQNGRILLRLDELEKRLDELEFAEPDEEANQSLVTSAATNGEERANRFGNQSLARSRIRRDGLKAGTTAPDFRLPSLDGSELSLRDLRGRRVLLVFSDPHCGPCQELAPHLEKFHRASLPSPVGRERGSAVVMISRGEPKENRAKVKEHGLTFTVLLQRQWEISRVYAMFATPMAYLIDEQGVITNDVAVGVESVEKLMADAENAVEKRQRTAALQDAGATT